jgi:hypothetical protein
VLSAAANGAWPISVASRPSRAEGVAVGGEDGAHEVVVLVEPAPRLVHAEQHLGAERVLRLRPVERDDERLAVLFDGAVVGADIQFFDHLLTPGRRL